MIIKADKTHIDYGALCYSERSNIQRTAAQPRTVVLSSFLPQRPAQIVNLIEVFSLLIEEGLRLGSVGAKMTLFKQFVDWADSLGHYNCLAGGTDTLSAFRDWVVHVEERFRRREIQATTAHNLQKEICNVLEVLVGTDDLGRGVRIIGATSHGRSVEPASHNDFSQMLALNHSVFDGLCALVLGNQPFPFKLKMPQSLGWKDSHLWIFPSLTPFLAPHLWGEVRDNLFYGRWGYDYANGRVASVEEISHRYGKSGSLIQAAEAVEEAITNLELANNNLRHRVRINLATFAKSAFLFLFLANTGCNLAVALSIETDGNIDALTVNQAYRTIKFRAQGKIISVVSPVSFMPTLRRYMELRKYLLGSRDCPYLFFALGQHFETNPPEQMRPQAMEKHYEKLLRIHPGLPRLGARKIRATVADYYRRSYDSSIASRIIGHSEETSDRNYLAGSAVDHKTEMTQFFDSVARAASKQKIASNDILLQDMKKLEEGGRCTEFGRPEAISLHLPVPDCRRGCLFCVNRILVSNEEDVRKVASAAFLMEQLISGPLSELEFRPQIIKCNEDLDAIAAMKGCGSLVTWVKRDVFINGNLTSYFADKYHMFLELGVL